MSDGTWSNRLPADWAPTKDAVSEAIARVERDAYAYMHGKLGKGALVIPDPLPPWAYDVAQDLGWIDQDGNVTQAYWQMRARRP